jgi:hypothetical protein
MCKCFGPPVLSLASGAWRHVVRKELIKAVRKLFDEGKRTQLPNFLPFKMVEKGAVRLGSACRWYRWKVAPDLSFFVVLKPLTKEADEFWVHVGWSRTEDQSDLADNFFDQLINLGKLWNAPNSWFKWKLTEPVGLQLALMTDEEFAHWAKNQEDVERQRIEAGLRQAPVCVQDAIDRIVTFPVPFFDRISEEASSARLFPAEPTVPPAGDTMARRGQTGVP